MSKPKRKALFLIPTLNPGGIETYLLRFLSFIEGDNEIDSHILVRSNYRGVLYESYKALNVPIHFQPLGFINLKHILWYYRFFKNGNFETVCDFNANFAGLSLWIAKKAGIKNRIVFYRQGKDHFRPSLFKKLYNSWVKSLVFKHSTQILSNSKAALDYFFPNWQSHSRFKVIYNGINEDDFNLEEANYTIRKEMGISLDALVVCHSGRLDPAKNHSTILKVAKKLINKNNNIYFVLCGLHTEMLQKEVDRLGLTSNVRLLGFRKDVPQILKASDMFYFPSLTEGQPNALIEAMLSELPFLASNIQPIKEIVPEEFHGFLVDPLDVDSAANLILGLLENQDKGRIGEVRIWAISNFSQEYRFREFYNCVVS